MDCMSVPMTEDTPRTVTILENANSQLVDQVDALQDNVAELHDEVEALRTEVQRLALLSDNASELVDRVREWLDWTDWSPEGMSSHARELTARTLKDLMERTIDRMDP